MIRRPPRSTLSSSSAASDVYKRQVLRHVENRLKVTSGTDVNHAVRFDMTDHMGQAFRLVATGGRADPINGKPLNLVKNRIGRFQIHGDFGKILVELVAAGVIVDFMRPL